MERDQVSMNYGAVGTNGICIIGAPEFEEKREYLRIFQNY
jgi:hypothetical protein